MGAERQHRQHRLHGTEQQCVARVVDRVVRVAADTGGEHVDVLLDPLVRVVDGPAGELGTEIREVAEPVVDEAVAQPDSPAHDEPLGDIHVEQLTAACSSRPAPAKTAIVAQNPAIPLDLPASGRSALEGDLHRGEQVVDVVGQQHVDADRDDHRQQQQREQQPTPSRSAAREVIACDTPELASPLGEPADQRRGPPAGRSPSGRTSSRSRTSS